MILSFSIFDKHFWCTYMATTERYSDVRVPFLYNSMLRTMHTIKNRTKHNRYYPGLNTRYVLFGYYVFIAVSITGKTYTMYML